MVRIIHEWHRVSAALDRATKRVLTKFGAYVRVSARDSLKPAKRKRISELTDEERKAYRRDVAIAKRKGKPKPKLPTKSANPGEAPRLQQGRSSPLRKLLLFAYDNQTKSVVVGPKVFSGKGGPGAGKLEYGRGDYDSFPYMRPALGKNIAKLPGMWKSSITNIK